MELGTVIHDGTSYAARFAGDQVLLYGSPSLWAAIDAGADFSSATGGTVALAEVELDAAVRPAVVLCAGQNYRDHLDEKAPVEVKDPEFFLKAGQTIAGPHAPCELDGRVTKKLDYETELGVVIGKAGRHITADRALEHVFGYVVCNDLTARDRQVVRNSDGTFGLALGPGKNFDGATRVASRVVTADEIADPQALGISTTVNDELRQSNSTKSMVFSIAEVIAYLSRLMTLHPGTLIATGTPGGTGWGMDTELGGTKKTPKGCVPGSYLAVGDDVRSAVEGVGEVRFTVVDAAP